MDERGGLDEHNLYFHTIEDLLRRYRGEADAEQRRGLGRILEAMIDHAPELGLSTDEVGSVRASCCREFLSLHGVPGSGGGKERSR